jgi:hypothetical protein
MAASALEEDSWYCHPRYVVKRDMSIKQYDPMMPLSEKIRILNGILPEDCVLFIHNDKEIFVLEKTAYNFYGDETAYPLELFVNKIIQGSVV